MQQGAAPYTDTGADNIFAPPYSTDCLLVRAASLPPLKGVIAEGIFSVFKISPASGHGHWVKERSRSLGGKICRTQLEGSHEPQANQ